jgi:hypothetical protein
MSYSGFLEFRVEGKILAQFLTALIFCFFGIKTKEHTILKRMLSIGLVIFSPSHELLNFLHKIMYNP